MPPYDDGRSAPGPVCAACSKSAGLDYLLAHLGIAQHGEKHHPAKDISSERWQKECQSRSLNRLSAVLEHGGLLDSLGLALQPGDLRRDVVP
jgi:hypothetical protein